MPDLAGRHQITWRHEEGNGGEIELRSEVNRPIDVLRSATAVNAELLQRSGELGCIKAGAYADILVLNGDPLRDPGLFRNPQAGLPLVTKGGEIVRIGL